MLSEFVNLVELHEKTVLDGHLISVEFHERGDMMKLNDAIDKRIQEVCKEKNVNVCDASLKGGMSPSALYDLIKGRTKCSKAITVKRFCEGAEITLKAIF